jgi:hypothetical protein
VNEGVGGAVDGQAAESLLVNAAARTARLLAQATAPAKSVLSPRGGIVREATSGSDQLLTPREIDQMIALSREVPKRFPTLRDAQGNALPADIEFAFRDGRLTLLQIRPFVESKSAQRNAYLVGLDDRLRANRDTVVSLDAVPGR